ncbi:hypothetical protein ABPG74_010261 [Tetrahymena malaccensis]
MSLMDCGQNTFDIQNEEQSNNIYCQTESFSNIKVSSQNYISDDMDKQKSFSNNYQLDYSNSPALSSIKTCGYDRQLTEENNQSLHQQDQTNFYYGDNIQPHQSLDQEQIFKYNQDHILSFSMSDKPISQNNNSNLLFDQYSQHQYIDYQTEEYQTSPSGKYTNQQFFNSSEYEQEIEYGQLNEENSIFNNNQNNNDNVNAKINNNQESENFVYNESNHQNFISDNQFKFCDQINFNEKIQKNDSLVCSSIERYSHDLNENFISNSFTNEITEGNATNFDSCLDVSWNNLSSIQNIDANLNYHNKEQSLQVVHYEEQPSKQNQLDAQKNQFIPQFYQNKMNRNQQIQLPQNLNYFSNEERIQIIIDCYTPQTQNVYGLDNVQKVVTELCNSFKPYFKQFNLLNQKISEPLNLKVINYIRKVVVNYYKSLGEPKFQEDRPNRQTHCMCKLEQQYKKLCGLQTHIKNKHNGEPVWCWSVKINEKVGRKPEALPESLFKKEKQNQKQRYSQKASNHHLSNFGLLALQYKRNNQS